MNAKNRVVIEVLGGVAEVTSQPEGIEVLVVDHDNAKASESVELFATGYQWQCPACGYMNQQDRHVEQVKCPHCELSFPVTGEVAQ